MTERSNTRIAFLDNSFTYGGAIVSLLHLLRGLEEESFDGLVVTGQPPENLRNQLEGGEYLHFPPMTSWMNPSRFQRWVRVHTHSLDPRRGLGKLVTLQNLLVSVLPEAGRYARAIRAGNASIAHLNNSIQSQLPATLAAGFAQVPSVAHARGFQNRDLDFRLGALLVAHHIAVSSAIREDLIRLGVREERVTVVHDAVDPTQFGDEAARGQTRAELGIPDGVPVFALFTRVVRWKGVLEFVEVAERVRARIPESMALVVGDESDGSEEYFKEVRRRGRPLEAKGGLRFLGYRPDIPELMSASDVIVHCSIEPEPFGMVIIEGMASRRPVVAMGEGGPLDIVEDGKTGILVPPRDPAALAQALIRLLQEPAQKRAEMGDLGRRRVEKRFSHRESAHRVAEVYRSILGGGS